MPNKQNSKKAVKDTKVTNQCIDEFLRKTPTSGNTSDDWLASTIKQIVQVTSIEDIKTVCCELVSKVAQLSTKISVDSVKKEQLEKENKTLRDDFTRFSVHYDEEIKSLRDEILATNSTCASISSVSQCQDKVEDLEARSRRNNLRFSGIPEGAEFGYDEYNMPRFLESITSECIGVKLRPGSIQRAHRVGPRKPNAPRQIIANFLCFQDKEMVKKAAIKNKPVFYNDRMYVNDDYTKIVMAKRKVLLEEQRRRKQRGQKAWISYDELRYVDNNFVYGVKTTDDMELGPPKTLFRAKNTKNEREPKKTDTRSTKERATSKSTADTANSTAGQSSEQAGPSSEQAGQSEPPTVKSYAAAVLKPATPMVTLAPGEGANPKKQRTPPSPPQNNSQRRKTDGSMQVDSQIHVPPITIDMASEDDSD